MIIIFYIHKHNTYLKHSNTGETKLNKNDLWKKVLAFGILFVFVDVSVAPASLTSETAEKTSNGDVPIWYKGDE